MGPRSEGGWTWRRSGKHRVVAVVGYDRAELLDIACVTTTLGMANHMGAHRPYHAVVVTPGGRPIELQWGLSLGGQQSLERLGGPLDTLIVAGGLGHADAAADPRLVGHVRRLAALSQRVASMCTGVSVLAAAGLLNGRRVTTHWAFADGIAARYPTVDVDPEPIYIRDGSVATSGGVTSALDVAPAFVEEDHGPDVARHVSRHLVTYLKRPGSQAQMSMFTAAPPPDNDIVSRVVDYVASHLDADLSTGSLAALAGIGQRHLNRLFTHHTGQSAGRYVRRARVEAAANLLSST
jgi:transcriptional regulator GlxA family with amidase domain